jgi:hypothetical protein
MGSVPVLANFRKPAIRSELIVAPPRYPHFATLIPRSKTHVSQSEARAYNQFVGEHEGCKPSNDRGFYEIGFLPRKVGLARPVCPALQLSVPVSAGPCRSHGKKACA